MMKIYKKLPQLTESVITIGSFDGLHLGHQYLITEVQKIARARDIPFYLISFEPHPRLVLKQNGDFKLLQTWQEKIAHLEQLGVEHLIALPFTEALSQKSAEDFILNDILIPLQPKIVVLGYDHKFGKDRQGSKDTFIALKEKLSLEIEIIQLNEYLIKRAHVSSSIIRNHIQNGSIDQVKNILGYEYSITGKVIEGKQLGRTLGYPTANILTDDPNKLIPKKGVYSTSIVVDGKRYKAATSIGLNPTVEVRKDESIESYILDFDGDIYGESVCIDFKLFLREEKKFDSIEELINAMASDVALVANSE